MKKSRYSDEPIVRILREADQMPVTQVAKKNGVSEATIYTWRKRFGEMEVNDVRHLKQLEQENGRLKKLLAERDLEIEAMKQVSRKKWSPRLRGDSKSLTQISAGFHNVLFAGCFPWRDPHWLINPVWHKRTHRFWRQCGAYRGCIHALAIDALRSS